LPLVISDSERRWGDSMSEAYQRLLAPVVFEPFAVDLVRRVAATNPKRVLELAAGTGVVTSGLRSALPDAEIIATDLNEAMVAFGREHVPQVTWQQADALDLPFDDDSVDVVVCQFGVMFFPNKRAGYAEMRRVLQPGGSLIMNTWDVVATHEFAAALSTALDQVFPADPPTFVAAVPHGYPDPAVVVSDIRSAGFEEVSLETITLRSPPASAADVAVGFCTGTPLRAAIEARADLASTTEQVADVMQGLLGTDPVTARMTAHVIQTTSL
jgi:ubiquinone/menaquinone biosynthesis C-methylase UbiE